MIVFRADISPQSGALRLRRSAWLAALLAKGNRVLVCSREDKRAAKFLAEKKLPAALVKDPGALDLGAASAIIFDLAELAKQDLALLNKAKQAGIRTIQVVPAGGEPGTADIAISGAELALLHHKFRHFHKARRKFRKKTKNIFVNLGDLLPYRDLRAIVETLHRLGCKMKIAPGLNLKKADKRNLMKIYPGVHFCGKSESPARAYFEADLALIPPGDEAWEAACVGTPALYVPLDKGQGALAEERAALGIGVKAPALADWSVQAARAAIEPLDQATRERMGAAGKKLVDGLGVQRFLTTLKESGIIA